MGKKKLTDIERLTDTCLEHTVLGYLMCTVRPVTLPETITNSAFTTKDNQDIFNAILNLRTCGLQSNVTTVQSYLHDNGYLGTTVQLTDLVSFTDDVTSTVNFDYFVNKIVNLDQRRKLLEYLERAKSNVVNISVDMNYILDSHRDEIASIKTLPGQYHFNTYRSSDLAKNILPETEWLIKGILPASGVAILAGPPKVKKSWFALAMCIAAGTGGRVLGSIPVKQTRTLYISLEDGNRRITNRQKMLSPEGTDFLDYAFEWSYGTAGLRQYLAENKDTKFVVIDTLQLFSHIRDTNDYAQTTMAVHAIREIAKEFNVSILLVHHSKKGLSTNGYPAGMDDMLGSQGLAGAVDTILVMKKTQENCCDFYVNSKDLDEGDINYSLKWDVDTTQWILQGKKDAVQLGETQQKIMDYMSESESGGVTLSDIHKGVTDEYDYRGSASSIHTVLKRMVESGTLNRSGKLYSLKINEKTAVERVESVESVESVEKGQYVESVKAYSLEIMNDKTDVERVDIPETVECIIPKVELDNTDNGKITIYPQRKDTNDRYSTLLTPVLEVNNEEREVIPGIA
jgi:predicted transcriptional regulator